MTCLVNTFPILERGSGETSPLSTTIKLVCKYLKVGSKYQVVVLVVVQPSPSTTPSGKAGWLAGCRCTIFIPTSNQSQLLPPVHTNPHKQITHHQLNLRTLHRHSITPTSSPLSTPRTYSENNLDPARHPTAGLPNLHTTSEARPFRAHTINFPLPQHYTTLPSLRPLVSPSRYSLATSAPTAWKRNGTTRSIQGARQKEK